jgi:hypothetical protein
MINRIVFLLFLNICSFFTSAQDKVSLKAHVLTNHLYDYGYGLEKYSTPLDSIFEYSFFVDGNIRFNEVTAFEELKLTGSARIELVQKRGGIKAIRFSDGKNTKSISINKSLPDLTRVDGIYEMDFQDESFLLFYLSDGHGLSDIRSRYLGVLVDLKNSTLALFPKMQNSNSPLCLSDIDGDRKLEYIYYEPANSGLIEIYKRTNGKFVLESKYSSTLEKADGYVWAVDAGKPDFISSQYRQGMSRRK